jgi:hypothetical protein
MIDTEVTSEDILEYYQENNIVDFPKKKNGYPNMNYTQNKKIKETILNLRKERENKKLIAKAKIIEDFHTSFSRQNNVQQTNDTPECSICCEPINKNLAIFDCGHSFCLSCTIYHGRENNNCPCCRVEVCNKPVKREKMPIHSMSSIINQHINEKLYNRGNINGDEIAAIGLTLKDFISVKLNELLIITNNISSTQTLQPEQHEFKEKIIEELTKEVISTCGDVGSSIINWYHPNQEI